MSLKGLLISMTAKSLDRGLLEQTARRILHLWDWNELTTHYSSEQDFSEFETLRALLEERETPP